MSAYKFTPRAVAAPDAPQKCAPGVCGGCKCTNLAAGPKRLLPFTATCMHPQGAPNSNGSSLFGPAARFVHLHPPHTPGAHFCGASGAATARGVNLYADMVASC